MTSELFSAAPELRWLAATILMTAVLWLPYVVNRIIEHGLWATLRNPSAETAPRAEWAKRMAAAHANASKNLVLFAPLVIAAVLVHGSTSLSIMAATIYFWARLVHFVVYSLGLPALRTLAFATGWGACVAMALSILGFIG